MTLSKESILAPLPLYEDAAQRRFWIPVTCELHNVNFFAYEYMASIY